MNVYYMKNLFFFIGLSVLITACGIGSTSESCERNPSSCVTIGWEPRQPIVIEQGPITSGEDETGATRPICRLGIPVDYHVPWTEEGGSPPPPGTGNQNEEDDSRDSRIYHEGIEEGGWFKILPEINNQSPYHLIIDSVRFSARSSGDQTRTAEDFTTGYCSTSPLYIVDPKDEVRPREYSSYNSGNLVFYVDGLQLKRSRSSDSLLYNTRIPTYTVEWRVEGDFFEFPARDGSAFKKFPTRFAKYGTFTTRSL